MNIILIQAHQFLNGNSARLSPRQSNHVTKILKASPGDILTVGVLNGDLGYATLGKSNVDMMLYDIVLDTPPPAPLAIDLIVALPRPQMLKRILQTIACFGIRKCVFLQTDRVEKSFWQSPSATADAMHENLILGLEQAKATQLPAIEKCHSFYSFFNEKNRSALRKSTKLIAHPGSYDFFPAQSLTVDQNIRWCIAIGPEGGFTAGEITKFTDYGFIPKQLGGRIMKVETAVTCVLSRLI